MLDSDFAGNCALEVCVRAGRILPVLQSYLETNDETPLTERQAIALGSVLLTIFDGLTGTLERMCEVKDVLDRLAPAEIGDQFERWLADQDGPLQ